MRSLYGAPFVTPLFVRVSIDPNNVEGESNRYRLNDSVDI